MQTPTRARPASPLTGAWIGALTSLPVIALSYLANRLLDLPFLAFDLFDWLARVLPGNLITLGIDLMVDFVRAINLGPTSQVAKTLEQISALLMLVLLGAVFGLALALAGRRRPGLLSLYGMVAGAVLALVFILIQLDLTGSGQGLLGTLLWLIALNLAWGAVLGRLLGYAGAVMSGDPQAQLSRRGFVTVVGGSAVGLSLGAWGLSSLLSAEAEGPAPLAAEGGASMPVPASDSPSAEELAARIPPAPGTRPELSSNEDFYRIDINTRSPELEAESWRLEVAGLVDNPVSLTLEEIRALPAITQAITLSCISNRIGGDLISTSQWTGARLSAFLALVGVRPEAQELYIESADGFYESVAMDDLKDERSMLVYAMNSEPLPFGHGFPLRIYLPNRYGMKQPKWIQRMEFIDHEGPGYWVERGWSAEAFVRTTSVIDAVAVAAPDEVKQTIPVGGIAYAGARGISKVELQVDEGPWVAAQLRTPPLSGLTWVQWRYDWPMSTGRHTFRVRAYDQQGEMQILTPSGVRPDGATGVHELTVRI